MLGSEAVCNISLLYPTHRRSVWGVSDVNVSFPWRRGLHEGVGCSKWGEVCCQGGRDGRGVFETYLFHQLAVVFYLRG